ncbi:undecaprenyl-diphosphate phosphatase [Frankia sp. Cr1]|uniref:undecaprenyl-diphosphate phosphatase n=1 Tax=Frankia sp. Cr1 TaxID=3073931 RepID=UPI002AD59B88|nr:undecaprenyl-diphosphate phosphatase [Frankia sp. Cr1]
MSDLTYAQSIITGLLQGVTELFPVSSLGHSVLVPAMIGGSWKHLVTESATSTSEQSPYLAFIVALHVATAVALLIFFRSDWARIIRALVHTVRTRTVTTADERLAWLIIIATVPVGLAGLALEHTFRTLFAKPLAAALFLTLNGVILLAGESLRRRSEARARQTQDVPTIPLAVRGQTRTRVTQDVPTVPVAVRGQTMAPASRPVAHHAAPSHGGLVVAEHRTLDRLAYQEAGVIGLFQTLALFAGISRSGITMVGGLLRGLDHEDAARFSFLLATPVILAAGLLKLPTLAGDAGSHIHGQVIVGMLVAGTAAYLSLRFLTRYFQTRTLTPFAVYCLVAGGLATLRFTIGS